MCACFSRSSNRQRADSNIEALVASVRTGDVLLYDDTVQIVAPTDWSHRLAIAARIVRAISSLPCVTYTTLELTDDNDLQSQESDGCSTPRSFGRNRPVVGGEWLAWSDAALIVCVDAAEGDSTEPVVFVRAANDPGCFILCPLDEFVKERVVAGSSCAVRHLMIADEAQAAGDSLRRSIYSQRRANLRDKILEFQRGVYSASQRRPDTDAFFASIARALNDPSGVQMDRVSEKALVAQEERDYLPLLRASSSYLVMQTLYAAQVVRIDPRATDSARLLQTQSQLAAHLSADYMFSSERAFSVN